MVRKSAKGDYSKFSSTLIKDFIPLLAPVNGIITGYLFHVLGDVFTENDVHLFLPYQRDKKRKALYKLWSYKAGENKEATIVLVAASLSIIIWVVRYVMAFVNGINSTLT